MTIGKNEFGEYEYVEEFFDKVYERRLMKIRPPYDEEDAYDDAVYETNNRFGTNGCNLEEILEELPEAPTDVVQRDAQIRYHLDRARDFFYKCNLYPRDDEVLSWKKILYSEFNLAYKLANEGECVLGVRQELLEFKHYWDTFLLTW